MVRFFRARVHVRIRPHVGNLFHERVPAAIVTGNGFGKLIGSTQVNERGELETPILLTSTLSVWRVARGGRPTQPLPCGGAPFYPGRANRFRRRCEP
ncbi:P1 family peptidase [Archangium gephyra]|nr:P1 family peptidase [Archangium gephyra]